MQQTNAGYTNLIDASCKEIHSAWSGRLSVGGGLISAELFRYDCETPYRTHAENISLALDTGDTATLLRCTQSFGTRHHQFNAGYLLLGAREWLDTDKISIFEFCLTGAEHSLSYGEHRDFDLQEDDGSLVHIHRVSDARREIMRLKGDGYEVVLSKWPAVTAPRKENTGDDPTWISVHYDEARPLFDAFQIPYHIQTFFELSEGKPLRDTALAVRVEGSDELGEAITAAPAQLLDFGLYRSWRPTDYESAEYTGAEQIFRVSTPADRERTKNALSIWLARREQWKVTYWLASQFVHGGNVTDRHKLLQAMAWFESIPDYPSETGLNNKALREFRRESRELNSFKELGISEERFSEVLNALKRNPLRERIYSAIDNIREEFGQNVLGESIQRDCRAAIKFRDYSAHGGYHIDEEDFLEFLVATAAVETVALLATIRSLGVDHKRIRDITNRLAPHPYASYQLWVDSRSKSGA